MNASISRAGRSFHLNTTGVISFVRRYPIPIFAIAGLVVGGMTYSILNIPEMGRWIWVATLIIGGAPIVWDTLRGMMYLYTILKVFIPSAEMKHHGYVIGVESVIHTTMV